MRNFWKPAVTALAALAFVASVAPFVRGGDATTPVKAAIGETAPSFTLQDENGKNISLSDYAGKIVVLEWTNPGCPVVQRHYKEKTMSTLYDKYAPQDVVWIAINSTKGSTNAVNASWIGKQGIKYPVLNDSSGTVGHQYDAKTTPQMFVIDKTGKLVYAGGIDNDSTGEISASARVNYVSKALDELLAGKSVSTMTAATYGCHVHY